MATDASDLPVLDSHGLQRLVCKLLTDEHAAIKRRCGAVVIASLRAFARRGDPPPGAVVRMPATLSGTMRDVLGDGSISSDGVRPTVRALGPEAIHLVTQRACRTELLRHVAPLASWQHLIDLFRSKYPPRVDEEQISRADPTAAGGGGGVGGRGAIGNTSRSLATASQSTRASASTATSSTTTNVVEAAPVLTRMRAEAAAAVFAEIESILADTQGDNGSQGETMYLSQSSLDHLDITLYACKALTTSAFDAFKLALVTAVPPPQLPSALAVVIDAMPGHSTKDLEVVWEEAVLAGVDVYATAAPLTHAVAKRVVGLAYDTAVTSLSVSQSVDQMAEAGARRSTGVASTARSSSSSVSAQASRSASSSIDSPR